MLLNTAADRNGVLKDLISETGDITGVAASNGNILYLNPAGLRWMGLAPVQDTLGTLLAESDQAQFESVTNRSWIFMEAGRDVCGFGANAPAAHLYGHP
jgi:hypothetical protein